MDVILFQPYLERGGAEQVILKIAQKFNPIIYLSQYEKNMTYSEFKEFDVRVLKSSHLDLPASLFSNIDKDKRFSALGLAGLRFLRTKITDDYDVLNPHLMPSEWIRNRNPRVCWYCHCPCRPAYGWESEFMAERGFRGRMLMKTAIDLYKATESRVVPKIEKICTNSEFTRSSIKKNLCRDSTVIHPGVDPEDFACSDYKKIFCYPSRYVPEKRMEYAINAFIKAGLKGWKLVIAGHLVPTERNSLYLAELKRQSKGSAVELMTNVSKSKLLQLYSNCSAMLFSPIYEDWGIAPLEAMASSKPVISANEGGPTESIVNGKTGFLVNSPVEMAEKMRFLADHPSECEKMGKAGRKRVEQNYTWKIFLDKMDKAFKETAKM